MKCCIQWIGTDGKPTPDENDAVMVAQYHRSTLRARYSVHAVRKRRGMVFCPAPYGARPQRRALIELVLTNLWTNRIGDDMGQTVRDRQLAVLARCDSGAATNARLSSTPYATNMHESPLAAEGLISYRCRGMFGWIMIGARDHEDAWYEALRSSGAAKGYELVSTVNLDGPEPNWEHIACGEKLERCSHMAFAHFPELHGTTMDRLSTNEFLGKCAVSEDHASAYVVRGVTWIPTGNGSRKERWGKKGTPEIVWEELVHLDGEKQNRVYLITKVQKDGKYRRAPGVKAIYPPTLKDPMAVFAELRAKSSVAEPGDAPAPTPEHKLLQFLTGRKFREEETAQTELVSA